MSFALGLKTRLIMVIALLILLFAGVLIALCWPIQFTRTKMHPQPDLSGLYDHTKSVNDFPTIGKERIENGVVLIVPIETVTGYPNLLCYLLGDNPKWFHSRILRVRVVAGEEITCKRESVFY